LRDDFKSQVESRLDDLFHDDEETVEPAQKSLGGFGDHPLKALKAVLLSVEWEINDNSMEGLIDELKSLEDFYQGDKVILGFLRLLRPIARYIKARKGQSHPEATGLLSSVYNSLERVAVSKNMSRKEKETLLLKEVEKVKKLKEDVIRRREEEKEEMEDSAAAPPIESGAAPAQEPAPDSPAESSQETFASAVEEIKALIREEFRALREEVRLWRNSR
jgi:hypothetical protein